ncbi:hypothetical protein EJ06DRAFT_580112 [Trichodelitschia bisporula]|uniref:Uncharacterized protein n=1 Tax=Trichodelitschia bisporula TaxID=703511 RepID=A0A6G1I3Y4_9PEZI|nr:hypothetical protein EJ06DRAFT_580112 [Trichodelitschia bisporula]
MLTRRVVRSLLSTRISSNLRVARRPHITRQIKPLSTSRRAMQATPHPLRESGNSDDVVEYLEELYEGAREEFQIAAEETEDNTIYAADDRAAARLEFDKLKEAYSQIVDDASRPSDLRDTVRRRAGQRIRELEMAMAALEEKGNSH